MLPSDAGAAMVVAARAAKEINERCIMKIPRGVAGIFFENFISTAVLNWYHEGAELPVFILLVRGKVCWIWLSSFLNIDLSYGSRNSIAGIYYYRSPQAF